MADRTRFHPLIARLYDVINLYFEHRQAPPHRTALAEGLHGTVLEIGTGTGAMLPYFERESEVTTYYGVEPDPEMRRQTVQRLGGLKLDGEVLAARAENLPFADDSVDAVVSSCVFCSVPDVEASLSEIARVLAADGEFRFFEHVRSPGLVGRSQSALTPLWRRLGGNCHLDREFLPAVAANRALTVARAGSHDTGHYPIRRFVRGRAVPR